MSDTLRQHALDILNLTGGLPEAELPIMSPFNPPYNIMENYGCEQIRTYGAGGYGFGTIHKIQNGYATALHVTQVNNLDLVRTIKELELKYGDCIRIGDTDLHLFGTVKKPSVQIPRLESGLKLTIVGCPAGSTFPEIHHVEYYLDNPDENGHWVKSVKMTGLIDPKAVVGGNSGGGVYEGHLRHDQLKDAVSIGHVRAEGSIFDNETDKYDHFAIVSFWSDFKNIS